MPLRRIVIAILVVAFCAGGASLLDLFSPTYYLQTESRLRDAIARSGRTAPANPNLLFLAIDSASLRLDETLDVKGLFSTSSSNAATRPALDIMKKGWPCNRDISTLL